MEHQDPEEQGWEGCRLSSEQDAWQLCEAQQASLSSLHRHSNSEKPCPGRTSHREAKGTQEDTKPLTYCHICHLTSQLPVASSVTVFLPSSKEVKADRATMMCLINDF